MIDSDNSLVILGKENSIKHQLEYYFQMKNYQITNALENTNKSFIPIIVFPYHEQNVNMDTDKYLNQAIDMMSDNRSSPKLLFFIHTDSNNNRVFDKKKYATLKELTDSIINIKLDVTDTKEKEAISHMIEKIGETIENFIQHPPSSKYIITVITPHKENPKIGVVGLGYVGLPVAVSFSEKFDVIGFDINEEKINQLNNHIDPSKQFSVTQLKEASIEFVSSAHKLRSCDYIFVSVPTPITNVKKPDLSFLKNASSIIGRNLTPHTTIVYESTVYPGTTEEICIPILEEQSQLTAGKDFYVGYSPERINPGDPNNTFKTIPKVISGQNKYVVEKMDTIYRQILDADIYKAPSIKVAEAAKILENTQRDINIALMNEIALICKKLNINTNDVIEAAKTKWNFIPFTPGLVGGHCIGVDPYYLIYKSMTEGYHPKFLEAAREINEHMSDYIIESFIHLVISKQLNLHKLRITVLGITFKENISDIRNSKALEIVSKLQQLGLDIQVHDPHVSSNQLKGNIPLKRWNELNRADVILLAVAHQTYKDLSKENWQSLCHPEKGIVMDLKNMIPENTFNNNITTWRL